MLASGEVRSTVIGLANPRASITVPTSPRNGLKMMSIQMTPNTLKTVWARAALFADVFPTAAAMFAVIVVPMFSPRTIAQASGKSISPDVVRSMVMAMVALEAWSTIVRMVPARRNMISDQNPKPVKCEKNTSIASLLLRRAPAEFFMKERPRNMMAKPTTKAPMLLFFCFLDVCRMNPRAMSGTENTEMSTENPRAVTHAVRVVPILAPMITPMALPRVRRPAFTKLTTMIVVADDDCTRAVTPRPVSTRLNLFEVICARKDLNLSPAVF